jgi:hypothetical protein
MKKRSGKKISLNRETLRDLSSINVSQALGGASRDNTNCVGSVCATCTGCSACPNTCLC